MKKLQAHLQKIFPTAHKQASKCSDLGLVIPNTESMEVIKSAIRDFFLEAGYVEVARTEETELSFENQKGVVYIIIPNLSGVFRFLVVEMDY